MKIELGPGETCAYMVTTECGVPAFKPSSTVGFDIETIDYTDTDIGNVRRRRVLTATDNESGY
jgi:hypothetical protein